MKKVLLLLSVFLFFFVNSSFANPVSQVANSVTVKDPEVRVISVNNTLAVISMELDNKSNQTVTLIAANSPVASETQLHQTIDRKMAQVKSIFIKPHGEDDLQGNSFHIMLMGIKSPLKTDDIVPLTLIFSDGSSIKVNAKVDKV